MILPLDLAPLGPAAPAVVGAATDQADLVAARVQMAVTLGFHIVLACFGVAFPALMLVAEWWAGRRRDPAVLDLARHWSKVMAVTFAVGAVSGTVLSFEMGLLWPGLMGRYGGAIGIPFAIEGIAFFSEAIFIAIYIYGWERLSPGRHLLSAVPVAASGLLGTSAVVSANAWMNQPAGISTAADGTVTAVAPLDVLLNAATGFEVAHMWLAAYLVVGFTIASVAAVRLLRDRSDHVGRVTFAIGFSAAVLAFPAQGLVGDVAARAIRDQQPAKFAAMELVTTTGSNQPETIGGVLVDGKVEGGLAIPDLASLLSGFSADTVIVGLDQVPADEQPPATIVHLAWDAMNGAALYLGVLVAWGVIAWLRRSDLPRSRWFLRLAVLGGPAAVVALEAGWVVTEVGRQPWIVDGLLRTEDAVTGTPDLPIIATAVIGLYVVLAATLLWVIRLMSRRSATAEVGDADVPYGPRAPSPR